MSLAEEYLKLKEAVDKINNEVSRLEGVRQTQLGEVSAIMKKYGVTNLSGLTVLYETKKKELTLAVDEMKVYVEKMTAEVEKARKLLENPS